MKIPTPVAEQLLAPGQLDESMLQQCLHDLAGARIDYADIYLQSSSHEAWVLEDSIVKSGSFSIESGLGIRAISGEKTGFAYADSIDPAALTRAAQAAKGIADQGGEGKAKVLTSVTTHDLYQPENPLASLTESKKIALLQAMDKHARKADPRIKEVTVSLTGVYEHILVAATDGTLATDIRPLVRLNCSVLAEQNGRRERGSSGGGGRVNYHYFFEPVWLDANEANKEQPRYLSFVDEAVRQALIMLESKPAPAGTMPVVLGNGWPGVLLHEAVGHGLEGDFNRKGSSAYAGRIGEQVAAKGCTIVDDGTLANRRGYP